MTSECFIDVQVRIHLYMYVYSYSLELYRAVLYKTFQLRIKNEVFRRKNVLKLLEYYILLEFV